VTVRRDGQAAASKSGVANYPFFAGLSCDAAYFLKFLPAERSLHMEKITRKVTATVIHYSEAVLENGMPAFKECPSELVADAVDSTQALAYLRKKYGTDRSFLVTGLETSTKKYEMDLALFVKTATPVMEVNAVPDAEPEAEQTTPAAPTSEAPAAAVEVAAPAPVQEAAPAPVAAEFTPAPVAPVEPAAPATEPAVAVAVPAGEVEI
jgi:hypothetical protein